MERILIAVGILGGLGVVFGLVLAAASKIFYVETDPRLDKLNECLPGANCGGCGYAGCGGYAEAVLKGETEIGKCNSGGNECAQAMAAIMGVQAQEVTRQVALVRCSGAKALTSRAIWCPAPASRQSTKASRIAWQPPKSAATAL